MAIVTITADYIGKIPGSLVENRNTAKSTGLSSTVMTAPTPYQAWASEYSQVQYDNLKVLATGYHQMYNSATSVNYSLYSFDIITAIEKVYGQTLWRGGTTLADKIAVATEIVSNISGKASGRVPSTLKTLYLSAFDGTGYDSPVSALASVVTTLTKTAPSSYIDANGYIHFLFYNQAGANQFMEIHFASSDITLDDALAPPTPTNVMATAEVGKITVIWTGDVQATSYNVQRKVNGGAYTTIANVTTTTYEDTIDSLDTNTYYYRVNALNPQGESEYSAEVSCTAIPEYVEKNIFIDSRHWTGGGLPESIRLILVDKYNVEGKHQTIREQPPYVSIRTYN